MNNKKIYVFLFSFLIMGFGTAALSNIISNEDLVVVNVNPALNLEKACVRTADSIACVIDVRNHLENYSSVRFENLISTSNGSVTCDEFNGNNFVVNGIEKEMVCEQKEDAVIFYLIEYYAPKTNYLYFGEIKLLEEDSDKEYIIESIIKQKVIPPVIVDPGIRPYNPPVGEQ